MLAQHLLNQQVLAIMLAQHLLNQQVLGIMLAQHLLNQQVLGMSCMAMFAAFPSTIMDSTTVELAPEAQAPLLWRRPEAASIIVDGEAANIAIQLILNTC